MLRMDGHGDTAVRRVKMAGRDFVAGSVSELPCVCPTILRRHVEIPRRPPLLPQVFTRVRELSMHLVFRPASFPAMFPVLRRATTMLLVQLTLLLLPGSDTGGLADVARTARRRHKR